MNELTGKFVYIAAPLPLLKSDLYKRAVQFVLDCVPETIIEARGKYKDNREWLANYERDLRYCNVMVIANNTDVVGMGVYREYSYIKMKPNNKVYLYFETGGIKKLLEVTSVSVINENDWREYAVLQYT